MSRYVNKSKNVFNRRKVIASVLNVFVLLLHFFQFQTDELFSSDLVEITFSQ